VGTVPTAAGPRPLSAFCAVLGWSRYRYVRFTTSQRFAVLATGLAGCFEHVGGVPARVLFDYVARYIIEVVCPAPLCGGADDVPVTTALSG
ncbi:MAG: hypothetical protein ACREQ5_19030, partial [Candidatus Dormibacteria bacterium]